MKDKGITVESASFFMCIIYCILFNYIVTPLTLLPGSKIE